MEFREQAVDKYWSTHYGEIEPKTREEWDAVLDRLELNFGKLLASLPRDAEILDLPCGVGYLEVYLLRRGFTRVRALDASGEQVQVAQKRLAERDLPTSGPVSFSVGDAFADLRSERRYDVIAAIDFLEHLPRERALEFLRLCRGALKPGGALLLRTSSAENPFWGSLFFRDLTHEMPYTRHSLGQSFKLAGLLPEHVGYEILPPPRMPTLLGQLKMRLYLRGRRLVAGFLGFPPESFAEDLVAIARPEPSAG